MWYNNVQELTLTVFLLDRISIDHNLRIGNQKHTYDTKNENLVCVNQTISLATAKKACI